MTDSVPHSASAESNLNESANNQNAFCGLLQTSIAHQILTLIGFAFVCFEVLFIELYFDNFWFGIDLSMLGIPAILAAVGVAQLVLSSAETEIACRSLSFVLKGKPLLVYRKWLLLTEHGIVFGSKHIRYEAIDELELSWFGNLIVKSRIVCGSDAKNPDIVLKFPFAAASFDTQELFLAAVKSKRPTVKLNKKLESGRNPTLQKGSQATQLMTASLMTLLLLDVGFSSFYFLEMLKNLYLAETDLLHSSLKDSNAHFSRAENLRLHPLPISWVTGKFLKDSTVAAGIWEQRSRVLSLQGKPDEAIENSLKAIKEAPKNLRHRLFLTRLYVDNNKVKEANEQLDKIIEDHKHSLMPRLYILALDKERESIEKLNKDYKSQLDVCYADTYEDEPHWPPGGNRFFTELFYSDDLRFVLDRFTGSKYKPEPKQETKSGSSPEEK